MIRCPKQKSNILELIFEILSDTWFNECLPQDLKRTLQRPISIDTRNLVSIPRITPNLATKHSEENI